MGTFVIGVILLTIVFCILKFIFSVLSFIGKWLDKKFPPASWDSSNGYKPTYPIEHAPPIFNQTYSKELPEKKIRYSSVFPKSYESLSKTERNKTQYIPPVTTPTRITRTPSKKLHLQIDYIDNDGIETSREIVISGKSKVDNYYVHAKCLLRNELRMFKIRMVQHCFNPETGEYVSNIKQYVDDFYYTEPKIKVSTPYKPSNHIKREPVVLHLEYINADNEFTERDIRITSSKRNRAYSDYFTAYCFLRKGERQFKISGIRKCVNTKTGEIIDIRNFLESFYDKKLEIMPLGFFK